MSQKPLQFHFDQTRRHKGPLSLLKLPECFMNCICLYTVLVTSLIFNMITFNYTHTYLFLHCLQTYCDRTKFERIIIEVKISLHLYMLLSMCRHMPHSTVDNRRPVKYRHEFFNKWVYLILTRHSVYRRNLTMLV